jgi:hypothetical protein
MQLYPRPFVLEIIRHIEQGHLLYGTQLIQELRSLNPRIHLSSQPIHLMAYHASSHHKYNYEANKNAGLMK